MDRAESRHERMCLSNPKRECRRNGPGACRRCFERDDSAESGHELVHVVRFVKDTDIGREPVGAAFEFVARTGRPDREQRAHAWRVFKRDRPDENPMCWKIESVR